MKINKSLILILFIIISYPLVAKYTFVQHNQYEQIPLILRFLDSFYLKNDWVTNLNSTFSPRYFYTIYMGTFARFLPLYIVYFLNFLITISLVVIATFAVIRKIFKSEFTALVTTIIILYGQKITLGGNDLIGRDLDPPRMAFALVVMGIAWICLKRYELAAFFFAASSYFQPLIGFEVPLVVYTALLFSIIFPNIQQKNYNFRKIFPVSRSFFLYIILIGISAINYLYTFFNQNNSDIAISSLILIVSRIRSPFHYLPSAFPLSDYIGFILLLVFTFIFYRIYRKNIESLNRYMILFTVLIILLLCIISFIFSEIIPYYPVIIMQLFRLTVIIYWLGAIIVFGGFINLIENKIGLRKWQIIILTSIPFLLSQPNVLLFPTPSRIFFITGIFIWIMFISFYRNCNIKYYLLFFLIGLFSLLYRNYPLHITEEYLQSNSQIDIALWAKKNTSPDTVFLAPFDFYSFRLVARRAIIVDWLVLPFENKNILSWMERIKEISGMDNNNVSKISEDLFMEGYNRIDQTRISKLQKKYKFDYIAINKKILLPYPLVYSNKDYALYQIRN